MKLIAKVITAEEATWPKEEGAYVVEMCQLENGEYTGQAWGIFQGSKKKCEAFAENINEGFNHLGIKALKGV